MLTILQGDALEKLLEIPDQSVNCCVTSPPYWGLRDYGVEGQIGLEATPEAYVAKMVEVFREVKRVLREDGTLWLNLGDSYVSSPTGSLGNKITIEGGQANQAAALSRLSKTRFGLRSKNLCGIPWRVAFALQADGWYLRSDIIWHKPNPMPESVTDRPTKAHEYLFLLSKCERYYYDAEAISEIATMRGTLETGDLTYSDGASRRDNCESSKLRIDRSTRNKRTVWTVPTAPYSEAHFATFPPDLIKPCILAGCPVGGVVLDPFGGSGTTGQVALELGRKATLIELNPQYVELIKQRTSVTLGLAL